MKLRMKVALIGGALAVGVIPAMAVADATYQTPGYQTPPPPQAKAYGFYCQGEPKKHVKGAKGTPFSLCVRAMRRAENQPNIAPGQACKGELKKHVKGMKGTPFSRCVKGVAQLRKDLQQS